MKRIRVKCVSQLLLSQCNYLKDEQVAKVTKVSNEIAFFLHIY